MLDLVLPLESSFHTRDKQDHRFWLFSQRDGGENQLSSKEVYITKDKSQSACK